MKVGPGSIHQIASSAAETPKPWSDAERTSDWLRWPGAPDGAALDAAWSQRDMWNVIDQVSTAELGGASNDARHRSLADSVARWLAVTATPDDGVEALAEPATSVGSAVQRIDLEQVVGKYVGETEKNLDRIFSGARASGAVLLLDEADALLDRRTEVHDSHDRYANIETGFLLQRLERHDGVTTPATNTATHIDPGLRERAMAVVVAFPFPPR